MTVHIAKGQILHSFKDGSSSVSFTYKYVFSGCFAIKNHVGRICLLCHI